MKIIANIRVTLTLLITYSCNYFYEKFSINVFKSQLIAFKLINLLRQIERKYIYKMIYIKNYIQ